MNADPDPQPWFRLRNTDFNSVPYIVFKFVTTYRFFSHQIMKKFKFLRETRDKASCEYLISVGLKLTVWWGGKMRQKCITLICHYCIDIIIEQYTSLCSQMIWHLGMMSTPFLGFPDLIEYSVGYRLQEEDTDHFKNLLKERKVERYRYVQ